MAEATQARQPVGAPPRPAAATKTLADHLRTGLAFHRPDMEPEFVEAIGASLLAHLAGDGIARLWEAYVEAHDSVYELHNGADPFRFCDADWRATTVEAAYESAIADWSAQRDDLLDQLLALLPGHHHDPLPAKPELLESA